MWSLSLRGSRSALEVKQVNRPVSITTCCDKAVGELESVWQYSLRSHLGDKESLPTEVTFKVPR